jgi:hypothetical protein
MKIPPNPYAFFNPSYSQKKFFNRQFEIARLQQAVLHSRNVQLVGQISIGKSALLRYLLEDVGELEADYQIIPVYYDLSRRPLLRNGDDFYARIWQMMSYSLLARNEEEARIPEKEELTDPFKFEEYVNYWTEIRGYQFVWLLDEFGIIAGDADFDRDFFDNLRSTVAANPYLSCIVAAPRSLFNFSHEQARSSPLWNLLEIVRVNLFTTLESIQEIIHEPMNQIGLSWEQQSESFIYERGGQYPYFIKMAASALYQTKIYNDGQANFEQADQIFRETALLRVRHLWYKSLIDRYRPEREEMLQKALADIVEGRSIDDDLAEDLKNRSLIWENPVTGQLEPFSSWFADWIQKSSTNKRKTKKTKDISGESTHPFSILKADMLVEERYQVLKLIDVTKHSQIARGWDRELKRDVAIKCLLGEDEPNEYSQKMYEHLRREGTILAGCKHENIGAIFTIVSTPPGVVMEWIEGDSLRQIVEKGIKLDLVEIVNIGRKLADALAYVHEAGIYHRDIKPENIIYNRNTRELKLIDFDIARSHSQETITRQEDGSFGYVGTQKYSSPEQFIDPERVDGQSDIFSLGLVLYELLTEDLPFKKYGNAPHLYEDNRFPQPPQLDIPEPLYEIICLMLKEKPTDRPGALSLQKRLDEYCRELDQF